MNKSTKDWGVKFSHAEFAYNRSPTYATKYCPFEVVYGANARLPIDLIPLPKSDYVQGDAQAKAQAMLMLHAQVRARIEKVNARYKVLANKDRKQHEYKVGISVATLAQREVF